MQHHGQVGLQEIRVERDQRLVSQPRMRVGEAVAEVQREA